MVNFLEEDKDAVIFNPEESGGRVFLRLITAATGRSIVDVAMDESASIAEYTSQVGRLDRIKVVEPSGGISIREVERVLDELLDVELF